MSVMNGVGDRGVSICLLAGAWCVFIGRPIRVSFGVCECLIMWGYWSDVCVCVCVCQCDFVYMCVYWCVNDVCVNRKVYVCV